MLSKWLKTRINRFHTLGLNTNLAGKAQLKWNHPTEIQTLGIPKIMDGKSVVLNAETGAGKTLAYLLPMMSLASTLKSLHQKESPLSLVVAPSRHLQHQILTMISDVGFDTNSSVIPTPEGIPTMKSNVLSIGVGTPASIMERYPKLDDLKALLANTRIVAIDEADFLFRDPTALRFIEQLSLIRKNRIRKSSTPLQCVFAGATFAPSLSKSHKTASFLISKYFRDTEFIKTSASQTALPGLKQTFMNIDTDEEKLVALKDLVTKMPESSQCIVFVSSPARVKMVVDSISTISQNLKLDVFHGEIGRDERTLRLLRLIKERPISKHLIIATDILARGVDLKFAKMVLHFDFPKLAQDYLHRVGRTLRGPSSTGVSVAFVTNAEQGLCSKIEQCSTETFTDILGFKRLKL